MCLAVPMKLVARDGAQGTTENSGLRVNVMLTLVPEVQIGDYVLIHAGYALAIIDEDEAVASLSVLSDLGMLDE